MLEILHDIIELLLGGLSQMASGIGEGLSALAKNIFLDGAGTTESPYTLSVFGSIIIIFAGVSLAIGLSRWVVNFITGFGK